MTTSHNTPRAAGQAAHTTESATFGETSAILKTLGLTLDEWDALPAPARAFLVTQQREQKAGGWLDALSAVLTQIDANHPAFRGVKLAHAAQKRAGEAAHTLSELTHVGKDHLGYFLARGEDVICRISAQEPQHDGARAIFLERDIANAMFSACYSYAALVEAVSFALNFADMQASKGKEPMPRQLVAALRDALQLAKEGQQ